jgi:phosphatidate phosphatase PAH1
MLEGDGSCAEHYDAMEPPGTKVVITDVDGTLTTEDGELIKELQDGTYAAAMKGAADRLLQTWAAKGYAIVYITARPHLFRAETRAWLSGKAMPAGAVITAKEIGDASAYKTLWLERMKTELGWNIVAAYGNADTDISAYNNAGIPKAATFIIGPLAGTDGTVAIPNDDYSAHIASYVEMQPDAL